MERKGKEIYRWKKLENGNKRNSKGDQEQAEGRSHERERERKKMQMRSL